MAKRFIALLLSAIMVLGLVPAMAESANDLDWIDLVVDLEYSDTANFLDNPNDVVTPWIENKFHIRVNEVIQGGLTTIGFKERLATYIAANNLPDVVICGNEMAAYAVATGYYGQGYDDLIENNMPNLAKYFDADFWPRYSNNGVKTQIPCVIVDTSKEPYASDPYCMPLGSWALWVREDLLAKVGYTFTPVKEINAKTVDQGLMPTREDYAITPAIDTPEAFRELLEKIQALNIKVGDSDLIPFSSIDWSQFHVGSMFDFGHWRQTDDGNVGGFIGSTGAKDYYHYLNQLYQSGLVDADFIVQTSDQLQSKIAAGRVGAGMYIGDVNSAQSALYQTVGEDASIRFIPWPKADDSGLGAYDIFEAGFWRVIIRSDMEREKKERLIEYFDWFFSDEGMDVCSWGPAEAGLYTTDENGVIYLPEVENGWYTVTELKAAEGYRLDDTPHRVEVRDGQTATLEITNKAISGILLHKVNAITGEGIPGVSFILYDSGNTPIAQEASDDRGYVRFENLTAGRYYLRELENEGYIPDTQKKTVYVKSGETTEIEWQNTPITGQIQVTKVSADYNAMNGWPAGTPIPNTVFEVYNARTNRLVDTIRTDKNGLAVSRPLPLARYKIVESKAAEFYGLDKTPIEVEIEYAGQIVKASMTNKSLSTNVSIKKTGYVEVMPGQLVRYNFTGIANNSTTALESFYWRDTLPVKAVRLQTIYTGTWNTPGNYKIVYKTNLSGGTWRTLADNLSTSKNYVLDASPAALGLAANEYVTEFMAAFGIVPANFRQVEAPRVDCKALAKLTGGTQFVNQADAGGVYNGQWIMATSRWVTRVYAPSKPLPRTGY